MRRESLSVAARVDIDADGRAALTVDAPTCGRCTSCFSSGRATRLDLLGFPHIASLRPDARVMLRLPVDLVVAAALVLYGLPLAAMLCGAALGGLAGDGDVAAAIGGGLGLGVGVLGARGARGRVERALRDRFSVDPSA